jgi:hypothetical protein
MPRRAFYLLFIIALVLTACRGDNPPTPYPIDSEADFVAALGAAGIEVADTALVGWFQFGTPGRAYQVDQSLVYVYEFDDASSAEAVIDQLSDDGTSLNGEELPWQNSPHIWLKGRIIVTYDGVDGGTILLLNGLMGDFVNRPFLGTDEPYPPAVAVVIAKFLDIRHLEPGEIEVLGFETIDWPDGCLGQPGPDEACTEAEVPGWIITLQIGEEVLEVHTDEFGIDVRWELLED